MFDDFVLCLHAVMSHFEGTGENRLTLCPPSIPRQIDQGYCKMAPLGSPKVHKIWCTYLVIWRHVLQRDGACLCIYNGYAGLCLLAL